MTETRPTLSQWKNLYEEALHFKQIGCWTWMTEDHIFGIQNPKTGEIGYCCIIGGLGEVFGLIIYRRTEGLEGFRKLQSAAIEPGSFEGLLLHDCLSLTFDSRECVPREDQDIIKKLGLKLRGRNAYPIFRSLKPGYVPWRITADEADYLVQALPQAASVCMRVSEQKALLDAPSRGQFLVRAPEQSGDSIVWSDRWKTPDPVRPETLSVHFDEHRIQKLRSRELKKQGLWEFDYAFADMPIKETGRPFFPRLLLIVDHATGFIFNSNIAAPDAYASQFAQAFVECLEKTGFLPEVIHIAQDEAKLILEPITDRLGIRLTKVRTCKEANRARREFVKFMARR
jgi:hypothetical protein